MSAAALFHILLHLLVPLLVAWLFFRSRWPRVLAILLAGWVIDVDHLLAEPIYAPNRCSIGFHPLHTMPAIATYGVMALVPATRLLGAGLLIHVALDGMDCLRMKSAGDTTRAGCDLCSADTNCG